MASSLEISNKKGASCSCCGRSLYMSVSYSLDGKIYCYDCYQKEIEQRKTDEQARIQAYQYVAKVGGFSELPPSAISVFDKMLKEGRTIDGIKYSAYYCFTVLGIQVPVTSLMWIIRDHYDEASQYYKDQKEILEKNKTIDLNVQPKTVVINPKKLHEGVNQNRTKKKYKIEDL